jgi:hypothetical protein
MHHLHARAPREPACAREIERRVRESIGADSGHGAWGERRVAEPHDLGSGDIVEGPDEAGDEPGDSESAADQAGIHADPHADTVEDRTQDSRLDFGTDQ